MHMRQRIFPITLSFGSTGVPCTTPVTGFASAG